MGDSLKLEHVETNLVKLYDLLAGSTNIAKLAYHLTNNPLAEDNVTVDMLDAGYYNLAPFDGTIPDTDMVRIFINPVSGSFKSFNTGNLIYQMDIICPNAKWILSDVGKLRTFSIANEFNKIIDQKPIAGLGSVWVEGFRCYKVDKNYCGLSIFINIGTSTLKGGV
jgi:hypothetical protein